MRENRDREKERERGGVGVLCCGKADDDVDSAGKQGREGLPCCRSHTTSSGQLGFAKGALGFTLVYPLFDAVGVKVMHARQSTQLFAVLVLVLTYYT